MPKLLIVDDELDVREFAANFFKRRNIDVVVASSGEKALEMLDKENPNLVLLDIKMTGIDGITTLERIRQKGNQVKVVMVTGQEPQDDGSFNKCKDLGALDYIHKPLKLEELEKVVLRELK